MVAGFYYFERPKCNTSKAQYLKQAISILIDQRCGALTIYRVQILTLLIVREVHGLAPRNAQKHTTNDSAQHKAVTVKL